jgi:hypothetical protein
MRQALLPAMRYMSTMAGMQKARVNSAIKIHQVINMPLSMLFQVGIDNIKL